MLSRLADLPRELSDGAPVRPIVTDTAPTLQLPAWLAPSRLHGGFYIQRPLSSGAAGSVFVAQRARTSVTTPTPRRTRSQDCNVGSPRSSQKKMSLGMGGVRIVGVIRAQC